MRWTEGLIHVAMRRALAQAGWRLIAGEYPGGSDHELFPLNVVDPAVARDGSPDPRRHSLGELIPDIVAQKGTLLLIGEAKVGYDEADRVKLVDLLTRRRSHLLAALRKFARERDFPSLLPVDRLQLQPVLIFRAGLPAPTPSDGFSHLRIASRSDAFFEGPLAEHGL